MYDAFSHPILKWKYIQQHTLHRQIVHAINLELLYVCFNVVFPLVQTISYVLVKVYFTPHMFHLYVLHLHEFVYIGET
jgi:hypothetical protein